MKKSNKQSLTKNILKAVAIIAAIVALLLGIVYMIKTIDDAGDVQKQDTEASGNKIDNTIYSPDPENYALDEKTSVRYVNNIVIIYFERGVSEQQVDDVVKSIDGKIVGSTQEINQYQVKIKSTSLQELQGICGELEEKEIVKFATCDYIEEIITNSVPDDPWSNGSKWSEWFPEQWDTDNPEGKNWWAEAINLPEAWDYDLDEIDVGMIDCGIDASHEELTDVWENIRYIGSGTDFNHGTHVAGIISAKHNNKTGISGVNKNCVLYCSVINGPAEFAGVTDRYTPLSKILNEVTHQVVKGAKVINLSLGEYIYQNKETDEEGVNINELINNNFYNEVGGESSKCLCALLENGYDFVIVQSAGNGYVDIDERTEKSFDAQNNGLFCSISEENCVYSDNISASDIIDRIIVVGNAENIGNCCFRQNESSNAGDRVDICAPGTDIFSCVVDGYDCMTGTSMAAPIVTGVASLVWAANPDLSGDEVKSIVCDEKNTKYEVADNTSDKHPLKNTYRMVNAQLALEAALGIKHEDEEDYDDYVYIEDDFSRKVTLVLDVSASMTGTPMEQTKSAARKFVKQMLKIDDVKISIVAYSDYAEVLTDFTSNRITLMDAIDNLEPIDDTNIEDGLYLADEMLNENSADKNIIVLMSDGQPNQGLVDEDLIDYANELKDSGDIIYTLGFFSDVDDLWYSQYLMEQIATPGFHYEVDDGNNLKFFFGDLAEQIKGAKYIYIKIACPVDVTVTDGKEILSSTEGEYNTRTKFGNLAFEYNEDSDDETKVLRLREGDSYDVSIQGYDEGTMDYTIEFMDEEGNYSDTRNFYGIDVNENTVIDTVADPSEKTRLKVDDDGDGKYDITFVAKANQDGAIEKNIWIPIIVILLIISALIIVIYTLKIKVFNSARKERRRKER